MSRILNSLIFILICFIWLFPAYGEEAGRTYYDLGVFAYDDGDFLEAEKNLKKALELSPNDPYYNHYMGRTYVKMKRYDEAMSHFEKAWGVDPEITGLGYDIADLYYKRGDYSKSAELFKNTAKMEPSNVLALYYAGISLFKQQEYNEALDYLLPAADMSPSIKANGYYYAGICYKEMGDLDNALEKFKYTRDHTTSASLMESASNWIYAINKQKREATPYSLYLRLGYQYDDNVRLDPLDQDLYADEDDSLAEGYFSGRYDFIGGQALTIGAGYSHYQTLHNDLSAYDLMGSAPNLYATYQGGNLIYGLRYIPTYYWLDSDSYLMVHQIRPELTWEVSRNLTTRFSYRYHRRNYFQDNNKDGDSNEIYLDLFRTFKREEAYINAALAYEEISAEHPDECYTQIKVKAALSLPLPGNFILLLMGKYYDESYDNIDSFYNVTRKDAKYNASLTLSHTIFYDWLSVAGKYSYTNNDSNINDYQYERTVIGLSLAARF